MVTVDEQKLLEEIADRLTRRHVDVSPEVVKSVVGSAYADFDAVRIRDFVPVLVERRAAATLTRPPG
jgi:hypothetical protein